MRGVWGWGWEVVEGGAKRGEVRGVGGAGGGAGEAGGAERCCRWESGE